MKQGKSTESQVKSEIHERMTNNKKCRSPEFLLRSDPDVPRRDENTSLADSYRLPTPECMPERTRSRVEKEQDSWSQAGGSECSEEPQKETRGETSNISSKVVEYKCYSLDPFGIQ